MTDTVADDGVVEPSQDGTTVEDEETATTVGDGPEPGWALSRKVTVGLALLAVVSVVLPGFVPADNVAGEAVGVVEGGDATLSGIETQHSAIMGFFGLLVAGVMWWMPRGKWLVTALLTTLAANFGSLSVELLQSTNPTETVTLLNGQDVPIAAFEPGLALYVGTGVTGIIAVLSWVLAGRSTVLWIKAKAQ